MTKPSSGVRPALLAGQWYPGEARACRQAIESFLSLAPVGGPLRGLVAPHAGWTYSGAASVRGYAELTAAEPNPDLVVLFGSHRSELGPNTIFRGDGWATPLGVLPGARDLADRLAAELRLDDEPLAPRRPDNGVELHLPFVRHFFPAAELLMLGVAAASVASEIGRRVGAAVKEEGRRAVFVASTDLTHYGPNYGMTDHGAGIDAVAWVREVNDSGFIARVLGLDGPGALEHARTHASACCPGAVAAMLAALETYRHAPAPRLVDHSLSYDVRPSDSFVGYASIVL